MTLRIDIPDELAAALKISAEARGISPDQFVNEALEKALSTGRRLSGGEPFQTGYGMWAKYGPAPTAEEIDENRREMFQSFAQDF
jgi:hypothetical protein